MIANQFTDRGHVMAIDFALRIAAYSNFLWIDGWTGVSWVEGLPSAQPFGLDDVQIAKSVRKTLIEMTEYLRQRGAPVPDWELPDLLG